MPYKNRISISLDSVNVIYILCVCQETMILSSLSLFLLCVETGSGNAAD